MNAQAPNFRFGPMLSEASDWDVAGVTRDQDRSAMPAAAVELVDASRGLVVDWAVSDAAGAFSFRVGGTVDGGRRGGTGCRRFYVVGRKTVSGVNLFGITDLLAPTSTAKIPR